MGIWDFCRKEAPFQVFDVGTIDPRVSEAILVPLQHHRVRAEIYAPRGPCGAFLLAASHCTATTVKVGKSEVRFSITRNDPSGQELPPADS